MPTTVLDTITGSGELDGYIRDMNLPLARFRAGRRLRTQVRREESPTFDVNMKELVNDLAIAGGRLKRVQVITGSPTS